MAGALHRIRTDLGRLDDLARGDSPLHRLDPRAKLLAVLAFVAAVVSLRPHAIAPLAPLALVPLFAAVAGGVPFGWVARRVLAVLPFVLLIAVWNPVFDRTPAALPGGWEVSAGWVSFVSIVLRSVLTVWAALILVAVTGLPALCAGLERLGAPRLFAWQILFLHRYLFLLAAEASSTVRARELRGGSAAAGRGAFGSLVGHLLLRTYDRAQRIHRAMACRGFDGRFRTRRPLRFGLRDAVFLAVAIPLLAVLRWFDLAGWLGERLLRVAG